MENLKNIRKIEITTYTEHAQQTFAIDADGRAELRESGGREDSVNAGTVTAFQIFFLISSYLEERQEKEGRGEESEKQRDPSAGYWNMRIFLTNGSVRSCGDAIGEITAGSAYLSGFIRQRVRIRDMLLFDGKQTGDALR